jgi:hypothetical protein
MSVVIYPVCVGYLATTGILGLQPCFLVFSHFTPLFPMNCLSLIFVIISDSYSEHLLATIGMEFASKVAILNAADGKSVKVKAQIWDTAGTERYRSVTPRYVLMCMVYFVWEICH